MFEKNNKITFSKELKQHSPTNEMFATEVKFEAFFKTHWDTEFKCFLRIFVIGRDFFQSVTKTYNVLIKFFCGFGYFFVFF
jgi:carbamoylphosphate synthase large subunit